MSTKDITIAAIFAGLISISAYVVIPLSIIPFSLQVFSVSLTAISLPKKQAMLAIVTYILIGLIGVPVFAGGRGGPQVILSLTFGFIIGFIPMVYIINTLFNKLPKNKLWIAFVCGSLALYAVALPILYLNLTFYVGKTIKISTLLLSYWIAFIPTDLISLGLSYIVYLRMPKSIIKNKKAGN
ncbi:MAG: biotin transporter BioY [Anaerorhabdus sp.]